MWRLLFFGLLTFALMPVLAYSNESCSDSVSEIPSMQFDYEAHTYDEMPALYVDAILGYFNSGAALDELAATIELANQDMTPHYVEIIQADFTADNQDEILLSLTISWGGTFEAYLMLFTCEDGNNHHLDTVFYGGWDGGDYGEIVYAMDINNNQLRDIVLRYLTVEGMKVHETLVIYEWDGDSLEQTFHLGPYYGSFSAVQLVYNPHDATSPSLHIGYFYAYEEETAMAFIEYSFVRSINMIYQWDGQVYQFVCNHFSDNPINYPTALHSAETYRACGDYETAKSYYSQIRDIEVWNNNQVNPRSYWSTQANLIFPENLSENDARELYLAELERAYYPAFAAYRLLQIAVYEGSSWDAEYQISWLNDHYSADEHGYVYAAMANAYWETYQEHENDWEACRSASLSFDAAYANGDNPQLQYADDPTGFHFGFYWAGSGRPYAADPDNLFEVPYTIDGMVSTPICL